MDKLYLLAMANFLLSMPSMFICLCRLNAMDRKMTLLRVRIEYAVGAGVLFASAFRPLIGEWPGITTIGVSFYVLVMLIASNSAWRNDTPPSTASQHGALRQADGTAP